VNLGLPPNPALSHVARPLPLLRNSYSKNRLAIQLGFGLITTTGSLSPPPPAGIVNPHTHTSSLPYMGSAINLVFSGRPAGRASAFTYSDSGPLSPLPLKTEDNRPDLRLRLSPLPLKTEDNRPDLRLRICFAAVRVQDPLSGSGSPLHPSPTHRDRLPRCQYCYSFSPSPV